MSTPREDRYTSPENVTPELGREILEAAFPPLALRPTLSRRGAIGRLFGLGAGAVAATVLPSAVEAAPVPAPVAEPVTVLPDWLQGRPEWFLANVERYARSLATLRDPLEIDDIRPDAVWSREHFVVRTSEITVGGMNLSGDELDARLAEIMAKREADRAAKAARTPVEVPSERIATAGIGKLDRNQRRRVRRWIEKQPAGPEHPIIRLRLGRRVERERQYDYIDVAQGQRHDWSETPFSLLDRVMVGIGEVIGPRTHVMACCHFDPRDTGSMYALPDGTLVETMDHWRRLQEMA